MIQSGQITPSTFVWKTGLTEWIAAEKVVELQPLFGSTPPPPPPKEKPSKFTTLSWIGLGTAGALAIGAGVTGILALNASSDLENVATAATAT